MIEEAAAPLRGRMAEAALGQLIASLSMVMGIEASSRPGICQLDPNEPQTAMWWAAQALVRATEAEAARET